MMRHLQRACTSFLMCAFLLLAAACAGVGMPAADTFNKKVAASYSSIAIAADMGKSLYMAGKLSRADAQNVEDTLNGALEALTAAQLLASKDPLAAENRLDLTIKALTALRAYLLTKQQGSPT